MSFDEESNTVSKSSTVKEQGKKEWSLPVMREFIIGQITDMGTHCAGDACNSS